MQRHSVAVSLSLFPQSFQATDGWTLRLYLIFLKQNIKKNNFQSPSIPYHYLGGGAAVGSRKGCVGGRLNSGTLLGVAVLVLWVSSRWCCDGTLLVGLGEGDQAFRGIDGACNWNTKRIQGKSGGLFHAEGPTSWVAVPLGVNIGGQRWGSIFSRRDVHLKSDEHRLCLAACCFSAPVGGGGVLCYRVLLVWGKGGGGLQAGQGFASGEMS